MACAAHLVLDTVEAAPAVEIDDVLEAVLMLAAFLGDQRTFTQPAMWTVEIVDVDLDVVPVVLGKRSRGLRKAQFLSDADGHARNAFVAGLGRLRRRAEDLAIEPRDA